LKRRAESGASARLSSIAMRSALRLLIVALIVSLVVGVAAGAVVAQEGEEETTETTVVVDDGGAAVPAPVPEELGDDEPWTARYLPQTLVLLTVLVIGGVAAYYFFRIRGRYEVVQG